MRSIPALLLALVLTPALVAALVAGSARPYRVEAEDAALVRLSWRAVGEHVEACRAPTPDELAALPIHMRQREICEARLSAFRLQAAIDGKPVLDERIRPAGVRQDRPTYILEEFPVVPGSHRVHVRFTAEDADGLPLGDERILDTRVRVAPRDVVSIGDHEGSLVVIGGTPAD